MAAVSVFVDDVVQGRLPSVCAKTGEPTDMVIRSQEAVRTGPGAAWLLVFLGPPGWVALLLVAMVGASPERLTVRIPRTDASYRTEKSLGRLRLAAFAGGLLVVLYGIVRPGLFPALWLVVGGALLLAALALHLLVWRQTIGVSLDASRRWVTLTGVHRAFVLAVEADQALGRLGPGTRR